MPKGRQINSTSKQIMCNVYDYFENESRKRKGSALPKLGKKTSKATGYCKQIVEQIIAEERILEGAEFTSPEKWDKKSRLRIVVDDFDCDAIRCTVHEFHAKKEYPTLDKLLQILKEKELFTGGRISL